MINEVFQQLKERDIHPAGNFDNAGRFYPADHLYNFVSHLRSPSRSWPYSYMQGCRTKKFVRHVAEEFSPSSTEELRDIITGAIVPEEA